MTTSKKHSPLTELSKTSSFLLIAKQTAHADSPSSLLPTTTSPGKLSRKWMELTLWVGISVSTKPKSVAHNKTAVAVVATVETVAVAAVAVIAVVVVAVIAVAVVVTTKGVGKKLFLLNFKKAHHFRWAFFWT
jgi:subtilase family serine protease